MGNATTSGEQTPSPLIFIVDDQDSSLEPLRLLLTSHGWQVESFSSASDCMEALDGQQPLCIVSDLHMPDIDGIDFKRHLVRQGHLLPMVIMTASLDPECAIRIANAGIAEIVIKPFDIDVLEEAILRAVMAESPAVPWAVPVPSGASVECSDDAPRRNIAAAQS